jgi:hypothetical protein
MTTPIAERVAAPSHGSAATGDVSDGRWRSSI